MSNFLNSQSFRSCNMLATRLKEPSCVYSIIICLSCACTPEQQHQVQQLLEQERGEGGEREREERERRERRTPMDNICITTTANAFSTATTPTTLQLYCIFFLFFGGPRAGNIFSIWGSTRRKTLHFMCLSSP